MNTRSEISPRVRIGVIGCGRISREHDIPGVLASGLAEIVALCDVDSRRLADTQALVQQLQPGHTGPIATTDDYKVLLALPGIDAVVISTPDHWHAAMALEAIRAGKDVYLQKPMTLKIGDGILLRDETMKTDRILQVGSQQRSMPQFRLACELVRNGRVGRLQQIEIGLPADPTAPDAPAQAIPANLDYPRWMGPSPSAYYTEQRVHPQHDYSRPGWLRTEEHCLGMITGWGSHHFDIAHWAMDLELSGPIRAEGRADFPTNSIWNVHGSFSVDVTYPNGVLMKVSDAYPNGVKFIGDQGWLFVTRDAPATASDPFKRSGDLKSLDASRPEILDPNGLTINFPRSTNHHTNWLEAVLRRSVPLTPAPVAHRSNTACVVSWIAMKLGRAVVWDPKTERFPGDAEANALASLPPDA